jgi:MATE family multidrug resistance protein
MLNFVIQEIYMQCFARQNKVKTRKEENALEQDAEEVVTFEDCFAPLFTAKTFDLKMWGEFLRLGIPGTLMQCAEWWAFELLAIFAGIMGTHQLAAQVAVINIIGLIYMIPLGIQFAAAALVGEQFGANNAKQA